jgi:aspartyl-tRNA(Asn)/glutamyl-tRNA(Gln) amidotransferase subunit C
MMFYSEAGSEPRLLFRQERAMGKKIDEAQVRKVAKLSRLDLSDAEVEEFAGQLSAILEYVAKMNELDTTDVEPLAHCLPISNVFREDCVKESLGTKKTLANAPQRDGEFFKVPKILDEI